MMGMASCQSDVRGSDGCFVCLLILRIRGGGLS